MRVVAEALGIRLSGRVVFEDVSFDWRAPGVVAVTGPNGAGKTTLMKALATLLAPGRGALRHECGGRTLGRGEARRRLGFAGPEVALYDDLGALENLEFFARARGLAWTAADGRAWLERLGLAGRGEERLATFSSGMKQRVKLAFALQGAPALVLLDEPGSNLDARGRAQVEELVREAAARALVVVATNDEAEARWGAERLELAGGR